MTKNDERCITKHDKGGGGGVTGPHLCKTPWWKVTEALVITREPKSKTYLIQLKGIHGC